MSHKTATPAVPRRDVNYFREQIALLSQPTTNRERMLLELYEQLVEKHSRPPSHESR